VVASLTSVLSRSQRRAEIAFDHKVDGRMESYIMSVEWLERPSGGAVVTRTNVTARRQAQIEIEEQRRQLSHLARVGMLGQLSGAFAHELNQPLTAILSNAEAAHRMLLHQPVDVGYVDDILRDIIADDQRAAAVIQRLRAMLKRGTRRLQPIEAKALIMEVLELAHSELIARHVVATSSVDPTLPPFAGDKVQLQQVLLNLVLNACESMSGAPTTTRELIVTAHADGPASVHFAIRDTGSGIAPELIDRLFEPFVTTKNDGLGLGLSISRTIVSAHGGRMWGENNSGGGATMHCLLPLAQIPQSVAVEQAPSLAVLHRP
jgi:C4-dicarboxylate-specific signal transduction histidine kinase